MQGPRCSLYSRLLSVLYKLDVIQCYKPKYTERMTLF